MKNKLTIVVFLSIFAMFFAAPVFAAHNNSAQIEPEWSTADVEIAYTVTICDVYDGNDSIDEVRLYETTGYNITVADSKTGWYKSPFNPVKKYYQYTALDSSNYIDAGECTDFTFTAITPEQGEQLCDLKWKFETRDINDVWKFAYDYTSVDELPPEITKEVIGPQVGPCPPGQGEECWVMDHGTEIVVHVVDNGTCKPPSGLDYCEITYTIDGQSPIQEVYADLDGELTWDYRMTFDEDSVHALNVTCVDRASNTLEDVEVFRVDSTPPITTKVFIGPQKIDGLVEWIDGVTTIEMTAVDPDPTGYGCNIGVDKTWYRISMDQSEQSCWNPAEFCKPAEDVGQVVLDFEDLHGRGDIPQGYGNITWGPNWSYYDKSGISDPWTPHSGVVRIYNNHEPVPTFEFGEDVTFDGAWFAGDSERSVQFKGYNNGALVGTSGILLLSATPAWLPANFGGNVDKVELIMVTGKGPTNYFVLDDLTYRFWNEYTGPIGNISESCHMIEYYSTDLIGNKEDTKANCFFVDKTSPEIRKDVGDPSIPVKDGFDYWVTQQTPITLNCEDVGSHPSNDVTIYWNYTVDGSNVVTGSYKGESKTIYFPEDSVHRLEFWCKDAVQKESVHDIETFKVDTVAPNITKVMHGPYYGTCPPTGGQTCFVDTATSIEVQTTDGGPICAVGEVLCQWKYRVNGGEWSDYSRQFPITFPEECTHELQLECWDALGNKATDTEIFLVDKTKPVTTKTYGTPFFGANGVDWITSNTTVTLSVDDAGPHKSGIKETKYRVTLVSDDKCWNSGACQEASGSGNWTTYSSLFKIPEESCHLIEYYSVDNVDKTEVTKKQCVFVDNTVPETRKSVGTPQVVCEGAEVCDYYITQQTPITLSCIDGEPHPVDHVSLWYRYRVSDDCASWGNWTNWTDPNGEVVEKTIYFPEDSCHQLEYYCKDILGNTAATQSEIDIVDTAAPVITKTMDGPYYGQCPPQSEVDNCYVDNATSVLITATDPQPHPVGDVTCQWRYSIDEGQGYGKWSDWYTGMTVTFPEESYHKVQIVCEDALGNTVIDEEVFIADHTPPVITKTYGKPFFEEQGIEWITSATKITLSAKDPEPHPSGLKSLEYRVTMVADENCRDKKLCDAAVGTGAWIPYEDPFTIGEQSCHLIEIVAKDNVDKTSNHKQCVFVDNAGPNPLKTVGEPKEAWDGLDANFYKLGEFCKTPGNCWKVTILTPINLSCADPEPHPVDHEQVCFKVELDAKDATARYCGYYDGHMNESYCCMQGEIEDFKFNEVSEHNLAYYCTDALGNKGVIDDEKFKVDDTAFEIQINSKWNLISTPVVLLDNSMGQIFDEDANCTPVVMSVWTYDAVTGLWHIYTPDGDDMNDDLDTMVPGDGYWVLADDDCVLKIGGSLMQPAKLPPSKDIVTGWNLIGYYGTDGQLGYYGPNPNGNGKYAKCALNTLGSSMWDKGWTSLWGYWEPYNPNQWAAYNKFDRLDPGAGYWMLAPADGIYAPSTTCV